MPQKDAELVVERSKDPAHPDRLLGNISQPTITITWPEHAAGPLPCVVICPGGGYTRLVIDGEGHDLAKWFNQQGLVSVVLKYRLPDGLATVSEKPRSLLDAQRAIRLLRNHAAEWGIQPDRIVILGGSAGGHLAATVSTHFDMGNSSSSDPVERQSSRPDFQILRYPVINMMDDSLVHAGSRKNLLGEHPTDEAMRLYSDELHVTAQIPPGFVAHAKDDQAVPYQNSVLYAEAMKARGVPCTLYLLDTGGHGFHPEPAAKAWFENCAAWLKQQGLSNSPK